MTPDQARYELVLKRLIAVIEARDEMLAFTRLMMPTPGEPDDPDFSRYEVAALPPGDLRRAGGARGRPLSGG